MRNDFATFILSHGRADNMKTVKSLEVAGYTGRWYIICDDEDSQLDLYRKNFGEDRIIVFNKPSVEFDRMDNFEGNKAVVFARNVSFKIAKDLGLKYFWELDDDYLQFALRPIEEDKDEPGKQRLGYYPITNMDDIINAYLKFLDVTGALCVSFAQGGDLLGGIEGDVQDVPIKRKVMNTLFCRVDRPFTFIGRINEDVNTYIQYGKVGGLFLQITNLIVYQEPTQKQKKGMAVTYALEGTYVKSFYTVMINPSAVKVKMMRSRFPRIHHKINWNNAVPKILSSDFKK